MLIVRSGLCLVLPLRIGLVEGLCLGVSVRVRFSVMVRVGWGKDMVRF